MRFKDGSVDNTKGVIVHNFHLCVSGGIGIRVEFFDKFSPSRAFHAGTTGFLIDEPTIKSKVFGNLVKFFCIRIFAILFDYDFLYPFGVSSEIFWREENLTQYFHTGLMGGIYRACGGWNDNTF